jgi:hypothetical protein
MHGDRTTDMRTFRLSISIIPIILICFLFGCEKAADISSPAIYKKRSIHFSYPKNWKITEDAEQKDTRYIFIESPGDAIFIIQIYPKQDAISLNEFAEWFSAQTEQENSIGNINKSSLSAVEKSLYSAKTKGIKEKFSIALLGMQVPHIREYYSIDSGNKIAFLVSQTATEDLNKVEVGFNLILGSFFLEKHSENQI